MRFLKIKSADVSWVEKIYQNYCASFPEDERRNDDQFHELFTNLNVEVLMAVDKSVEIGYLVLWKLSDCFYLEHFEVFREIRNHGFGAKILQSLKGVFPKIILESEPEGENVMAARRIQFYKRNGFHIVERDYVQPPYEKGKESLNLFLMSNFELNDKRQCIAELHRMVYGVLPDRGKIFEKKAPK